MKPETPLHPAIHRGYLRRCIAAYGHGPEATIQALAYRSAATACALHLFGHAPESLSLSDDRIAFEIPTTRSAAEEISISLLAGGVAVRRLVLNSQQAISQAAVEAARVMRPFLAIAETQLAVRDLSRTATALVNDAQFWSETEAVAAELLSQLRLNIDDVARIVEGVHRG
jgi:hypothetical protein